MARLTEARKVMTAAVAYRDSFESLTLAADLVLTAKSGQYLRIDPNGSARNVDLPGASGEYLQNGEFFEIVNVGSAAEDLTVRLTGGGSTVVTVTPGDRAKVYWTGSTWSLYFLDAGGYS